MKCDSNLFATASSARGFPCSLTPSMPASHTRFIRTFIYLLGGFTQHVGHDTGMMRLWVELFRWRDRRIDSCMMLMPREWNDSIESMAAMLDRHAVEDRGQRRVILCGYSYGGGWTAPGLARELKNREQDVDLMILIDPVWRARLLPAKALSFTGRMRVSIPSNVRRVLAWRQTNGGPFSPKGSALKIADPKRTEVLGEIDLSTRTLTHSTIQYDPGVLLESLTRIITQIED